MIWLFYLLALAAMILYAPAPTFEPGAREFIFIIGAIGIWRYSWGLIHFVRAIFYLKIVFPRRRRRLEGLRAAAEEAAEPALARRQVFIVMTSFRIPAATSALAVRAAVAEAVRYGGEVVIVASIVELADQRLIKHLFKKIAPPARVRLVFVRIAGTGKRDGLAAGLCAIARLRPRPGAAVLVMDGDAVLPPGTLERCLPFFETMPQLAGITTDEDSLVDGNMVIRQWHRLRFAQRHVMMCSMALSNRLLTMTGRMSIFRHEVATDPSFIRQVRDDLLDHWRLGRIKLLTGEDKSTWYWLLKRELRMLYVPDVRILTIEHPPQPGFFRPSSKLMMRWFGNMLRSSSRAIGLGPRRLGAFVWWSLIDQRISMWTPLIGPLAAIALTISGSPVFLYIYALWVMITRLIQALLLLFVRDFASGLWPLLIYYSQVWGALIKTYILFRPHRQRWTRQGTTLAPVPRDGPGRLAALSSIYVHGLALLGLAAAVAFLAGLLSLPGYLPLVGLP